MTCYGRLDERQKSAWKVKAFVNGLACSEVCSEAACQSVAGDKSREKGGEREIESKGLRKWEKIQGDKEKKKKTGRGLVWFVCGDLQRANAVSLPSGSLASVWSLRNTPAQQPPREHVKTRSPKVTLVLSLSHEYLKSARTIPLGHTVHSLSVLLTPPLVRFHNPFVHPLMTLAAISGSGTWSLGGFAWKTIGSDVALRDGNTACGCTSSRSRWF